jgi:hypothetical protein
MSARKTSTIIKIFVLSEFMTVIIPQCALACYQHIFQSHHTQDIFDVLGRASDTEFTARFSGLFVNFKNHPYPYGTQILNPGHIHNQVLMPVVKGCLQLIQEGIRAGGIYTAF